MGIYLIELKGIEYQMIKKLSKLKSTLCFHIGSRLFKNMSWLFVLNFSNTIIPYFTFPYITRVFLPEGYGKISFALSFIAYFQTLIEYGFTLTGARIAAIVEGDSNKLSKAYSSITAVRILFFVVSIPLILLITINNKQLYEIRELIYILIVLVFSNTIMPIWLFQGLQKIKYMTIISVSVRTIFIISVFTFIKSKTDIYLYSIIYSISFLIIGIISMIVIRFRIKIKFCKVSFNDIKEMIKDGFYVFTSNAVMKVMTNTGNFVLGLFYPLLYTGYYSGISKISQVITMAFYPIGQALYPYHSKKYEESFEKGYFSAVRISKIIVPIFTLFALILIILRKQVVRVVLGDDYIIASNLLFCIAFLPLLSIVSNFMGTQILVASGHTREYSRAFLRGSFISIILFFGLGYFFNMWGVAIAALSGALFNLLFLYIEILGIVKSRKRV
jgi:PST family polysaccharide transporter